MPLSAKAHNCVTSVVRLSDDEVAEILTLSDQLQEADKTLSADAAVRAAVTRLIDGLKSPEGATTASAALAPVAPTEPTQAPSPFSGLGGSPNPATATARRVTRENNDGFNKLVDSAYESGDITKNQSESLKETAGENARGMTKAKDELMRLREKADDRRASEKEAGKSWDDEDFNWQEGDPKFADLSPASRAEWTQAVAAGKANGELYERLVDEQKTVADMPQIDTDEDIQSISNPDFGASKNVDFKNADMRLGSKAAAWLAQNGSTPLIRSVAARIVGHLDSNIPIVYRSDAAPASVQRRFGRGSVGVSALALDGSMAIYWKTGHEVSEADLLHELVHAATQRGIVVNKDAALNTEMAILQKTIQRTLRGLYGDAAKGDAEFFASVVENPHELLAYGFTSPALRNFLSTFKANGEKLNAQDAYVADQVTSEATRDNPMPAEPTLWQRLMDWARSIVGMPAKYQAAYEALVAKTQANRQEYIISQAPPMLFDRLDSLLDRALKQQDATSADDPGVAAAVVRGRNERLSSITGKTPATAKTQTSAERTTLPTSMKLPDFEPGNRFATAMKDMMGGWRNQPGMLGWMTLRQLGDRFKEITNVGKYTELSTAMGAKAKSIMGESRGIDQTWAKLQKADANEMQKLMLETTMEQMWPNRSFETQKHLDQGSASLRAKHAQFTKRFNALSEDARRTYDQTQAKMRKDWDERGRLLKDRIVEQYQAELANSGVDLTVAAAAAKAERAAIMKTTNKAEKRSLQNMFMDIDEHATTLSQMQGPYFPLMRFGEHVVVAKSNELNDATDAFTKAQERLTALNADEDSSDTQLDKAREEVQNTKAAIEDFKQSEKHYLVEFFESPSEASARQAQLVQHFAGAGEPMAVYTQRRAEHMQQQDAVSPGFMTKLQDTLSASLPDKDANAIRMAVRDLYIQSMPERSALKSQLRRIGVEGVKSGEMRRAFAAATMRDSWHLSRLEFGPRMNNILNDLRNGDSDEEKILGTEFSKRMAQSMQMDTSNIIIDRLSNLSYLTYLGASPSFFIMNAMQPWVISLPIIAGRHGMRAATVELGRAFNEVGAAMKASLKDQKTWRFELNLENFKDPAEREMLQTLFNRGVIDVTIEHDLGSIAGGKESSGFTKVMDMASLPAHHTEVINRVMTALAAYRLESKGGLGEKATAEQATKYAERVVADTHLDYTPENAPRFMRSTSLGGLGRIVFQFKKYMQGMMFLWGSLGKDAFKGDKEAQKSLMYLTGMQMATSGAMGLPFAAPIGAIAWAISKMYPDDDQPEWYLMIYKGMKDAIGETAARALMKGLPAAAGADLSGRLGVNFNPLAFIPPDKKGADYVAAAALALAGPAASMMANYAEAFVMAKDDPLKAAERALPKFMADPLRAIDRNNRGVTNKRGDTLISPDEFGPLGIMMRAVGFESTDVTDMYDTRGAFLEARGARDDVRKSLLKQAVEARQSGNGTESIQAKIEAFNERHEDDRIKGSTITQAAKTQQITARALREGVAIRKNDRALAERLGIGQ